VGGMCAASSTQADMWWAIIQLVLKVVSSLAGYLETKQLLDAGQAKAVAEGLKQTLDNMKKANAVKKELADNPDGDYAKRVRDKYEDADQ